MSNTTASVHWLEWNAESFARAAAEDKPVLLAITASWCHWCHEMDRLSYARPDNAALINARFVPIRVDSDQRPDINERYSLGGWPTTSFLTPRGEVLGGGTFYPPDRLADILAQVAEGYARAQGDLQARAATASAEPAAPPAVGARTATPEDVGWFAERLRLEFDSRDGGFGTEPKLPHAAALQLAIDLFNERRDPAWLAIFTRSLDAMGWGGLYDPVDGGFFRYATMRDWSLPHTEKLLEENAALILVYLHAWQATAHRSYRDKAIDVIRYVHDTLADRAHAGFFASQAADPAYYAAPARDGRRDRPPPRVDRTIYCDMNGAMAAAYLRAACLLDDEALGDFAVRTLERVVLAAYRPGVGLAHVVDSARRATGLLADHVWVARALVEAYEASGRLPFLEMAEELMRHCLRTMWDERAGGFFDRATGGAEADCVGRLSEPLKPLVLNSVAAVVLARLAAIAGHADLALAARHTLDAQAASFRDLGLHAAPYALALRVCLS